MLRKAQGLSLNTIIIAIVVLVVLVVVIMIFTGYFGGKFTPGITSCSANGGRCVASSACVDTFGFAGRTVEKASGCSVGEVCCVKGAVAGSGGGGASGDAGSGGSGGSGSGSGTGGGTGGIIGLTPSEEEKKILDSLPKMPT